MTDLKPRPYYRHGLDPSSEQVSGRLKTASTDDGPTDYANRINLEILRQLVAIRRHALITTSIVVAWAALTAIAFYVLLTHLPTSSSTLHY